MTEQKPTKNVSQAGHDEKGRFAKGNKISKGRSVGSRNKATLLAQSQMADRLPEVIDKLLESALNGEVAAQKVIIERLVPVMRDAPIKVQLPIITTIGDLPKASQAILDATAGGDITPNESLLLSRLLGNHVKLLEVSDIDERIKVLEDRAMN